MSMWEIFGWAGSVLVVVSLMIPSVRRFRTLNLIGSLIATIYNAYFGIWPYAAMNAAIVIINIYWLWRLSQEGDEQRGYSVVSARADDALVDRFLNRHESAIASSYPTFARESLAGARNHLVMHEEEVIGLFSVRDDGRVVLDFVTDRFRDFTPGSFVYSNKHLFDGITALEMPVSATTDLAYFNKQGFEQKGDVLVKAV